MSHAQCQCCCHAQGEYLVPLLLDDSLGGVPLRGVLLGLDGGVQSVGMVGQAVHHSAGHLACVHATAHHRICRLSHALQNGR